MASLVDPLISFVSANPWLGYLILFLAALLEAVPVVGSVVPGSTIILALAALVPGGELQLPEVLLAAIAGAALGDGSAYLAGHGSKREIVGSWPLNRYPRILSQSEAFFQRWGTWAILLARFVPPIRAFVPLTAGILGISAIRFFTVNIPAILLWAMAHILPGVYAVSALEKSGWFTHPVATAKHHWLLLVLLAGAVVWIAIWVFRRRHGGGLVEPAAE